MNKNLYRSIAASVFLMFGIMALSSTALAQTDADQVSDDTLDEDLLEEVIVTGSILRRVETTQAAPMSVITSEEFEVRGLNTVADAIQLLPANNAGAMNASWSSFGFATGATAVSLRGLTTSASLTLFDGMRMAPYPLGDDGRRNFVDVGMIPESIVSRIEVLKEGASSTYGADAIAGVVNVMMKKEITGFHFNGSYGLSAEGDGNEYRADVTGGWGELDVDGWNFYANIEVQKSDAIAAGERPKFGSWDWTDICNDNGACLDNTNPNGIQANGEMFGVTYSMQPLVRPLDADGNSAGNWQLIDPAGGCTATDFLIEVNPTNAADIGLTGPNCENDYFGTFVNVLPEIEREGLNLRYTVKIGDKSEAYAMLNYYKVTTTKSGGTPYVFGGTTPPGTAETVRVSPSPVILQPYVCPLGRDGYVECNADNGVLNPNNPWAAEGIAARVLYRLPVPRSADTESESFRFAAGIAGYFGQNDEWDYSVDFVSSKVELELRRTGYPIPRRILNATYDGSFNYADPRANDQAMWDYIAPPVTTQNESKLDQIQATIARNLWEMGGGTMQGAFGMAYREESVDNPSANPNIVTDPYERYLSVNTVSTEGERDVTSAFFELYMPVLESLEFNLSGRWDDYSTGQSNFSPKIGAMWSPLDMVTLRGSYSEGFRIPSFNEAFGSPTTGYISHGLDANTPWGAKFLNDHNNNAYASGTYSIGLTATGNPALDPEESTNITIGLVFEVSNNLSFTLDYWDIEVDSLISGADYSPAIDLYYQNNGVVDLEGITVIPAEPDPDFPNALPLLGFIQYSYQNADSEIARGVDLGAHFGHDFGSWSYQSHLDVSYLHELSKTIGGIKYNYEGTLSPCDVTSCSGAPDWRAVWVNTFDWEDWTFGLTMNYTGGYDNASTDYGGEPGNCEANIFASVYPYDDGTPFLCKHPKYIDWDFTAAWQVSDKVQLYANILNVFDTSPKFDPASAYHLYGFNPAWELNGWRGRFFRLGVRLDF